MLASQAQKCPLSSVQMVGKCLTQVVVSNLLVVETIDSPCTELVYWCLIALTFHASPIQEMQIQRIVFLVSRADLIILDHLSGVHEGRETTRHYGLSKKNTMQIMGGNNGERE